MDNNITDNQNFNYFNSQYKKLKKSAVDSTVGLFRFNNTALRKHIKYELHKNRNNNSRHYGLMGNPVFEVLFPWQAQQKSILDFSGSLLHKDVAKMLKDSMPRPYKHQVESWQLLEENDPLKSLVITSGTGSGKTECFMVPIINDLVKSSEKGEPLVGVEALFLYPLNALINSQRDRLSKWTSTLHKHDVRYCLYNGNTPEKAAKSTDKSDKEVKSREELRKNPPPILVTNATMLEYMLIRQNDAPIINASKKKLRWIVLDEAHSYTGSTAAELSLLLRRVMIAFDVDPKNIHFIATSATIGDDHEAQEKLKEFLARLAGVSINQVHVINAKRDVPKLNNGLPSSLESSLFLSRIMDIDPEAKVSQERYEILENHPFARKLRDCFITKREESYNTIPNDLNSLYEELKDDIDSLIFKEKTKYPPLNYLLQWLDVCANTAYSDSKPAFLPLRGHFFQRTLSGLYACVNPHCSGKHGTHLESNEEDINSWGFGYVYTSHLNSCEYCQYPVFELAFCNECQEPHLLTQKRQISGKDKYEQFTRFKEDDFTVDIESSDSDDESDLNEDNNQTSSYSPVLLMSTKNINKNKENSDFNNLDNLTYNIYIDKNGFKKTRQDEGRQPIAEKKADEDGYSSIHHCYACDKKHRKKPVISSTRLGGPFYISNAAPTLLEHCPATGGDDKPFQGRRMITFTDSRQGTARITMKLRQDSQRRTLRHIVYYEVAKQYSPPSQQELLTIQESIKKAEAKYESIKKKLDVIKDSGLALDDLKDLEDNARENLENNKAKAKASMYIQPPKLKWNKVLDEISQHTQFPFLSQSFEKIATINKFKDDKKAIAEVLLLNELAYRPKNANSLETMGLISLDYPKLLEIKQNGFDLHNLGLQSNRDEKTQELHKKFAKLDLNDWRDYLKLLVDFYVRDYRALKIKDYYIEALSTRYFNNTILIEANPDVETDSKKIRKWLQVNPSKPNNSIRLIKLLALVLDLDLHCATTVSTVNQVLNQAFKDLAQSKVLSSTSINGIQGYALDFENINLSIPNKIWVCPITRRILPSTFKGYTPYIHQHIEVQNLSKDKYLCGPAYEMSVYQPTPGISSFKTEAKQWLNDNASIKSLKEESLWTNLSDDVILGSNALITEEHSAQLDSDVLGEYEDDFKKGNINILNCSTTMEMGVDIGGISTVAMNNVPPHPANYLQRTGRAGRSRESTATSFTICKDNPHEQMVFNNTLWAFNTQIKPPYITLNSKRIIQRHINAYLMSHYLPNLITRSAVNQSAIILNSGWFFFNWLPNGKDRNEETKPIRFEDIEAKITSISKQVIQLTERNFKKNSNITTTDFIYSSENLYSNIIELLSDKAPVNDFLKELESMKNLDRDHADKKEITRNIDAIKMYSALTSVSLNDILDNSIEDLKKAQEYINLKVASRIADYIKYQDTPQDKGTAYRNKLIFDIRGVASGYLLSDLARHNFLPRYGFPSGLIEFDLYSEKVVKDTLKNRKKQINNLTSSTESLLVSSNKPVRDISIAIREYAPGNEVVIDGLVYKSAGLELSRYYNHSDSNDAQKIDRFARCNECGSMHEYTSLNNPLLCKNCDEPIPYTHITNFVEPMGFRVDYFTAPHNSIENQTYVPVEEPMVQANGDMYPLISHDVGLFRIDPDGVIFQQSKGVYGNGYLICLSCGRAESSRFKPSDGKRFQMQKDNFLKHVPMKPLSKGMVAKEDMKSGACNPNNSGTSVQHLYIGSVDQTNVFEIYLKDPDSDFDNYMGSDEHKTIISTLAVAFRDALAICHGIDREELGFSIKQVGIEQKKSWAISIYDKASGGAGFSSTANQYLREIFKKALEILNCDECDSACHSCLLSYDTRFISKDLNRVQALEYLNKIKGFMKLPDSAASLLPNAAFCYQDIGSILAQSITSGFSEIWLYLQGETKSWALAESLFNKVNHWNYNDISINIAFNAKELNNINNVTKLQLLQLMGLKNVNLFTFNSDSELLTNNYLLQIARYNSEDVLDKVLTLATTDKNAYIPNAELWKVGIDEFIVSSSTLDLISTTELLSPIDDKQLALDPQHNTRKFTFTDEFDVRSDEFGSKFWQLMRNYGQLNDYVNKLTELTKIEYIDPYVRSPFITMILGHILYSLKSLYAEKWSNPELLINTSFDFDNHKSNKGYKGNKPSKQYKLTHSWSDETQQKEVQAQFFTKTLELQEGRCEINLSNKSNLQHHRSLTLYWTDNTKTIITLDHGFGFIKLNSDIYEELRFIYKKDLNEQVEQLKKLMEIKTQLTTDSGKEHIIYLEHCIENRHD